MEFVSNKLRKAAKIGAAIALAANTYATGYVNYSQNHQYEMAKSAVTFDIEQETPQTEKYDSKPDERILPMHYFDGFVGAFNPETKGIMLVPHEFAPAENGNYSWEHIRGHEGLHFYADHAHQDHDEAWFNRIIANRLASRTGTDRFPFPSYFSYGMF